MLTFPSCLKEFACGYPDIFPFLLLRAKVDGWYSRKVTNFSEWLTLKYKSPVLWNTPLYHIHYILIAVIL